MALVFSGVFSRVCAQLAHRLSAAYAQHVQAILTGSTAEFTKAVEAKTAEAQMSELQKSFAGMVDGALKNAPAGSEQAVTLVKSAMTAATTPTRACTRPPSRLPKWPSRTSRP